MTEPHRHPVRIYYEDTDAGGIVYHANYLHYMERARTEMLRSVGYSHAKVTAETRQHFVMGTAHLKYKAPSRLDDELVVETQVLAIGGASVTLAQNIFKRVADTTLLLLEGNITLVYISEDGKALRIPQILRDALQHYSPL